MILLKHEKSCAEVDAMAKGYIYIMTNPCLQNMVKIGYAKNVEERRKQLSTTALPYEYEVYATYETSGKLADKQVHKLIDTKSRSSCCKEQRIFYDYTRRRI